MAIDIEMVDATDDTAQKSSVSLLRDLKLIIPLIERSVSSKESHVMGRVIRNTMSLRRNFEKSALILFVTEVLPPSSEAKDLLLRYLADITEAMDTDADPLDKPKKESSKLREARPEIEALTFLVVILYLLDQKLLQQAKECSIAAVKFLQKHNRRSLDALAARIYFYYSLAHEKTNSLVEIRSTLLALSRTATLRHDEIGQETLLNLLLRNYLEYSLYDQAEKLRSKVQRPDSHSNQQLCRYLYYLGRIRAIQLEYTDAKDCLLQAVRKVPLHAKGFRIACTKWAVIVRLLLGEIPERTTFVLPGMKTALLPYFQLTHAVRIGDLELFHSVADKYSAAFQQDRTHNLIVRLRQNVIRTGLRRINIAYSRISLADVAAKLRLDSPSPVEDAELIVAKAISDGGIDAVIDHDASFVQSKETVDIYSTGEPQAAFHSRIAFCLNTHNEAIKALRFPSDSKTSQLDSAEKSRGSEHKVEEMTIDMEDDDDEF